MTKKEKPYVIVKDDGPGHITTDDIRKPEPDDRPIEFGTPGPRTGESTMDDGEYIRTFATPEEKQFFREQIESRRTVPAAGKWRVLPSGLRIPKSHVLAICGSCGAQYWVDRKWAGGPCLRCNVHGTKGGAHIRAATPAEETAWFVREKAAFEKWLREAPERERELRDFNRHLFQQIPRR